MSTRDAQTWEQVWAARSPALTHGSTLAALMTADGLDTGFGSVGEAEWRAFVARTAAALDLRPGDRVFEVGCGSGAFLYVLDELGYCVGGLDRSAALIAGAQRAIPRGHFTVGDASALDTTEPADAVVAWGVFLYFDTLKYASTVMTRMAAKAERVVGIFDLPDAALRDEAEAFRRATIGEDVYEQRYRGLRHLYFDRAWTAGTLHSCGLTRARIESQAIDGYANSRFRFNAIAFR